MGAISLAVWLVTLPLVAYRFHLVSPWTVPLNLVLWIPVAATLFAGLGIFLFHGWLPSVADLCGRICELNLDVLHESVRVIASTPGSHFWVVGPTGAWVCFFYVSIALLAVTPQLRRSKRCWMMLTVLFHPCSKKCTLTLRV